MLTRYKEVTEALDARRLGPALRLLEQVAAAGGSAQADIDALRGDYRYMLGYMRDGHPDPGRHAMRLEFIRRGYELSTAILRQSVLDSQPATAYATTLRTLGLMGHAPRTLRALAATPQAGGTERGRLLFDVVYTSPAWGEDELAAGQDLMLGATTTTAEACIAVSAATLATMALFDRRKMLLLLDVAELSPELALRVRAGVGLCMIGALHHRRIEAYPHLQERWRSLSASADFVATLHDVQMQLIAGAEAETLERNVREEILPSMMKQARELRLDKLLGPDFNPERLGQELEKNPAWQRAAADDDWNQKMQRLMRLQQRGADLFINTFGQLKRRLPFFATAAHWFTPFDTSHPALAATMKDHPALPRLMKGADLCDSDKYAFCLTLSALPAAQGAALRGQLDAAGIGAEGGTGPESAGQSADRAKLVRAYMQDVHRFFRLFGRDAFLPDPFAQPLGLVDVPMLRPLFDDKALQGLADLAFEFGSYRAALHLYALGAVSGEAMQKQGFCHEALGHFAQAAEAYDRANLLSADDTWCLDRQARCLMRLGRYAQAHRCYRQMETVRPDDAHIQAEMGECLMAEGKFEEALAQLFKADYLGLRAARTHRALAWCLLATGRAAEALDRYARLPADQLTAADEQHVAHAHWATGDVEGAAVHYAQALRRMSVSEPDALFGSDDRSVLAGYDITAEDILIMEDLLLEEGAS